MPDLSALTNFTLLEDLGQHRRYEDRLRKSLGHRSYDERLLLLATEVKRRGLTVDLSFVAPALDRAACRLRPLADHVVILPREAETLSEGGIVIPETAKEKPRTGEVLAVGPGRTEPGVGTILPALSIGDEVLFGLYSGISFELDGQAVLIMREEDVLGVLQPKAGA